MTRQASTPLRPVCGGSYQIGPRLLLLQPVTSRVETERLGSDLARRKQAARHKPNLRHDGTVLAAVKDASRQRWPTALLDRGCARRRRGFRSGQRDGPQPNKETPGRL